MKPEDFADIVTITIKAALAPVLERVAVLETRAAVLASLPDRLVAIETKAAIDLPPSPAPVDPSLWIAPVLERMAAGEARVAALEDMPARMVTLETKAAMPMERPTVDLSAVTGPLEALVARSPMEGPDPTLVASLTRLERDLAAVVADFGARLAVVETKTDRPAAEIPDPVDVTPLLERQAAMEARLAPLTAIPDRVVALETRSATPNPELADLRARQERLESDRPAPIDIAPLTSQLATVIAKVEDIDDLRDKVVTLETKASSGRIESLEERFMGHSQRLARVETILEQPDPIVDRVTKAETVIATTAAEVVNVRERMAGVEARPTIPGPAGKDGADGAPGQDGVGFDDLAVEHDGERTFILRATKGERVKTLGTFTIPSVLYRGVYEDGRTYTKGDAVTWGGSLWVVNEDTATKPGDGNKAFQLAVKRGADGKNGRDLSEPAIPVVKR